MHFIMFAESLRRFDHSMPLVHLFSTLAMSLCCAAASCWYWAPLHWTPRTLSYSIQGEKKKKTTSQGKRKKPNIPGWCWKWERVKEGGGWDQLHVCSLFYLYGNFVNALKKNIPYATWKHSDMHFSTLSTRLYSLTCIKEIYLVRNEQNKKRTKYSLVNRDEKKL